MEYAWIGKSNDKKTQIDLLIDRNDGIINLCEMKYSIDEYAIDKEYEKNLREKMSIFSQETKTQKSIHITFITSNGLKHNSHSDIVQNELSSDDLFAY